MVQILRYSLILFFFLSIISCNNSNTNWKDNNDSIRPHPNTNFEQKYNRKTDFVELSKAQVKGQHPWLSMTHHNVSFFVEIVNDSLIIGERLFGEYFFELDDGKLEIINHGEFGGALNFIPSKNPRDTVSICKFPINYVFSFREDIYFLVGIAHPKDSGGALVRLNRNGNDFTCKKVVDLDSAPEAVAVYKNMILIAGHSMFTVIKDFKKDNLVEEAFWQGLYPNSITIKNENEIYVGMRGGYSQISLIDRTVKYFKYKNTKPYSAHFKRNF